jgi:fused signal recognition particle receptor
MFGSLKDKLTETRKTFKERFEELLRSSQSLEETLDQLAESLLLADIGVQSTEKIIHAIKEKSKKNDSFQTIKDNLEEEIIKILSQFPSEISLDSSQSVIMMVGVNGGGKTTSLAKLAFHFKQKGKSILMVAADTFRAAAQEQLVLWGKKLNIPVIKGQYGADPAAVIFDSIHSFKAHSYQLLLVDTAGRIHTNANLMNEMEKIKRVISKQIEGAPHEILLVLDATIGQNALIQERYQHR